MFNSKGKKCVLSIIAVFFLISTLPSVLAKNYAKTEEFGFYRYDLSLNADNVKLKATSPGGQFGTTMAKGDFNGDKIEDFIVGSPFYSSGGKTWAGKVSLFYGDKGVSTGIRNLKQFPPDVTFLGAMDSDQFGSAVESADINNDGMDDLIISAYQASSHDEPEKRTGRVYIIFGKKSGFPDTYDLNLDGADIIIIGNKNEKNLGISIAKGDFNGDKYEDIAFTSIGVAFNELHGTGKVHVLYGGDYFKIPKTFNLDEKPLQWTLYGQEKLDYFGAVLTSGDINGDARDDILVSSYFADNNDKKDSGKVYVYFGVHESPSTQSENIRASFYPDFSFSGDEAGDWFSFATLTEDMNKDSIDDLIVSAFPFSKEDKIGKVYLIYGRKNFEYKKNFAVSQIADLIFYGEGESDLLGASVAAGDFNGDKLQDLLLGAPGIKNDKSGKAYLFYGPFKDELYDLKEIYADTTIEGVNQGDWFANNVTAIDLNGDNIDDAAMSAMYSDFGKASNTGEVFVVFGKNRPLGDFKRFVKYSNDTVTRGDFVKHVIEVFGLETKKANYLTMCKREIEFCMWNFVAQSRFDDMSLEPNLIFYPDVYPAHPNYKYINIATMIGLMHGYMDDTNSPFKPQENISRIQALKVVLGASGLLPWKYKSDLIAELGGEDKIDKQSAAFADVNPVKKHMWWYPRYVNYAYLTGIIGFDQEFRPDDPITQSELDEMIAKTLELID